MVQAVGIKSRLISSFIDLVGYITILPAFLPTHPKLSHFFLFCFVFPDKHVFSIWEGLRLQHPTITAGTEDLECFHLEVQFHVGPKA